MGITCPLEKHDSHFDKFENRVIVICVFYPSIELVQMSAFRGVQAKYDEVYKGILRNIFRRTTKKCAICESSTG